MGKQKPQRFKTLKCLFFLFTISLVSCQNSNSDNVDTGAQFSGDEENRPVSYAEIQQKILAPRCISCHGNSGGVNLESYGSVVTHLEKIERVALVQRTMPPNNPLTNQEMNLLRRWISAGAPEVVAPEEDESGEIPPPETDPGADPDQVTVSMVYDKVILPKCVECHGASGGVNLESYDRVKAEAAAIKRVAVDFKSMPPQGEEPLTKEQLAILKKWIAAGAP